MRGILLALVVGSTLAAPAVAGESARPDNPSGFGQTAKAEAPMGALAREVSHNEWGPGAGAEVRMYREMNGGVPNPPKDHP